MNLAHYTRFPDKLSIFNSSAPIADYARNVTALFEVGAVGHNSIGAVLLKPELYLGGASEMIQPYLERFGFRFVGGVRFSMTPEVARLLWQYEPFLIGADREAFLDLWAQGPAFVAIFESIDDQDATLTITRLKGGSKARSQSPQSLRRLLQQDIPMLSFIHSCDEPLDLIREVGLILQTAGSNIEFGSELTKAAAMNALPTLPPLNQASYDALVSRLASQTDSRFTGLIQTLADRCLSDWPDALKNNEILCDLCRSDKLLIAATNSSKPPEDFPRLFPSIRHLNAR